MKLHNMIDIKPGLELLIIQLEHADPDIVFKFYQSLPEMEGLEIPEVTPPLDCSLQLWISGRVEDGDWAQPAERFCSISPAEPEVLAGELSLGVAHLLAITTARGKSSLEI